MLSFTVGHNYDIEEAWWDAWAITMHAVSGRLGNGSLTPV